MAQCFLKAQKSSCQHKRQQHQLNHLFSFGVDMGTDDDQSIRVQISSMKVQLDAMNKSIEDIKNNVSTIAKLDKSISEVVIKNSYAVQEIIELKDDIKIERKKREESDGVISAVAADTAENINKAKGAAWAFGMVFGTIQVLVVSSVVWVFSTTQENLVVNRLQQESLNRMESQVKELQSITKGIK